MIHTDRLDLIPATIENLEAELQSSTALAESLGVGVPASWPPELYDSEPIRFTIDRLRDHPDEAAWWLHYFVDRSRQVAVGAGGYKGPPDHDGVVEIGYSVLPEFRRRGYASEATAGMVRHAFGLEHVTSVIGQTLPHLSPSIGVLEKCGFRYEGTGSEEYAILFRLSRSRFRSEQSGG